MELVGGRDWRQELEIRSKTGSRGHSSGQSTLRRFFSAKISAISVIDPSLCLGHQCLFCLRNTIAYSHFPRRRTREHSLSPLPNFQLLATMDRRTQESPMDFSWANGSGPVDESSPFVQLNRPGNGKSKFMSLIILHATANFGTGTHSVLDSPSKSKQEYPNLRPAFGQTTFFNIPPIQASTSPSRTDKPLPNSNVFNTPRKFDIEPSSGGETADDTPGNTADSEATPDNKTLRGDIMNLLGEKKKSPKKKRESIFGRIWAGSPGRHYSTKGEKRVLKRRAKNAQNQLRRRNDYGDDSDDDPRSKDQTNANANSTQNNGWTAVGSIFNYIESHPQLPHILSFYAQLLLNLFLVFSCMYILYSFWSTIVSDVDKKSQEAIADALAEMAVCAKNYRDNGCEDRRAPALERVCLEWEKCMSRDPKSVGRARVSAHTFAEIFNSFIEPISYKAMVCPFLFLIELLLT